MVIDHSLSLISTTENSYYILDIESYLNKYYITQKHGSIGNIWPVYPFMNGLPIGDKSGYSVKNNALEDANKLLYKKMNKRVGRLYRKLQNDEKFKIIEKTPNRFSIQYLLNGKILC